MFKYLIFLINVINIKKIFKMFFVHIFKRIYYNFISRCVSNSSGQV